MPKTFQLWISFILAVVMSAGLITRGEAAGSADPQDARVLTIVPERYDLDLSVDFDKGRISGICRLTVRNTADGPASSIPFLLYRLLKVTSIKDGRGRDVPFSQRVVSFEDWEEFQANSVEARPETPLAAGGREDLVIAYEGLLLGYTETGMLYVKDRVDPAFTILRPDALAYPEPGVPSWEVNRKSGLPHFDYRLRVTVPATYTAANGGRLVDRMESGDRVTFTYENIKPAWRIDVAIAPYGILAGESGGLRIYYLPDDAEGARVVLEASTRAIDLLREWLGPRQGGEDFAVIEIPEGYGSQADVTCILQTRDAFRDPKRVTALYHEISHLWGVDSRDPLPPRFESEGLAMFFQYLLAAKLDGRERAVEEGVERCRESFRKACLEKPGRASIPMIEYGKARETDLSYTKGMIFFALLYDLMGEADFLGKLREVIQNFGTNGATADEFLKTMASGSRENLGLFFKEWVYGADSSDLLIGRQSLEDILKRYKNI